MRKDPCGRAHTLIIITMNKRTLEFLYERCLSRKEFYCFVHCSALTAAPEGKEQISPTE